jgi:hypothetical protein
MAEGYCDARKAISSTENSPTFRRKNHLLIADLLTTYRRLIAKKSTLIAEKNRRLFAELSPTYRLSTYRRLKIKIVEHNNSRETNNPSMHIQNNFKPGRDLNPRISNRRLYFQKVQVLVKNPLPPRPPTPTTTHLTVGQVIVPIQIRLSKIGCYVVSS